MISAWTVIVTRKRSTYCYFCIRFVSRSYLNEFHLYSATNYIPYSFLLKRSLIWYSGSIAVVEELERMFPHDIGWYPKHLKSLVSFSLNNLPSPFEKMIMNIYKYCVHLMHILKTKKIINLNLKRNNLFHIYTEWCKTLISLDLCKKLLSTQHFQKISANGHGWFDPRVVFEICSLM